MALRSRTRARASSLCAVAIAAALGGCSKAKSTTTDPWPVDTAPFEDAASPASYVPRVKTLLTGLPATDAEVQAVTQNPAALRALIDGWMQLPQFKARMLDFFRNAFQQNNVSVDEVASSLDIPDFYVPDRRRLEYGMMDTFPLTAWQLVQEGRPFNETITTPRYWLNTAQMAFLSYADMFSVDDEGDRTERLTQYTSQRIELDPIAVSSSGGPLTAADSIAALGRGRTGRWVWRLPIDGLTAACQQEIQDQRAGGNPDYQRIVLSDWNQTQGLFSFTFANYGFDTDTLVTATQCGTDEANGVNVPVGLVRADGSDWDDWRWVTVEQVPLSEEDAFPSPQFWDLAALRTANTLKLKAPRLGFLGTLAWAANWPTNESNQSRVIANQALIVSIGQSIIPAAAIAPAPVSASDAAHSTDPACAACHIVLDPLRQFFRQSYTFSYHEQLDLGQYMGSAAFLLGGMNQTGVGVQGLASILAAHPHFAMGWAQKLQFWANSTPASESDPELQRIAAVFTQSGFDFRVLVREVFSSPLVTLSRGCLTYRQQGVTVGIARRDQLCAAFSARLGIADACHLRTPDADWSAVNQAGQLIPTDLYYRAAELPALPRNPDLFFRGSVEALCGQLASQVVGDGGTYRFNSHDAATAAVAIADMVATIMNVPPGDPRSAPAAKILTDHYTVARTPTASGGLGATGSAPLRSTFTLACISPSSVLLGL